MRQKTEQLIITFPSTTAAIRMERVCREREIRGRLIPTPSEITAGCGLAWKAEPKEESKLRQLLEQAGLEWEEMQLVWLYG